MVSFIVRAGVVDHGMIMNVVLGNLGDPVWFLFQERTVRLYGKQRKRQDRFQSSWKAASARQKSRLGSLNSS